MSVTLSPNMSLPIPGVGTEAGPNYAQDVNDSLTLLDSHNHTLGQGTQIPTAGLNINADLTFNQFGITNSKHVSFTAQSSALTSVGTIYELNADLYFVDGNGNNVRITQSGAVAAAPGNITGLIAPASFTYVPSSSTFVAQSDVAVAANLDAGSLLMRNLSPNSTYALTLQPPTLTVDYSITLPVLPASQKIMTLDASGTMSAPYDVDNATLAIISNTLQVNSLGIQTANLADSSVTYAKLAAAVQTLLGQAAPPGSINAYMGAASPAGWLICDGSAYLQSDYAALYSAIGTASGTQSMYVFTVSTANASKGATYTNNGNTYTVQGTISGGTTLLTTSGAAPTGSGTLTKTGGTGDATITFSAYVLTSATFYIPDLRGMFLRGVDGSAGNDPDSASRTAQNPGGNTGNAVGSYEADILGSHNHPVARPGGFGGAPISTVDVTDPSFNTFPTAYSNGTYNAFIGSAGGAETRPKNVYVNYIIKT